MTALLEGDPALPRLPGDRRAQRAAARRGLRRGGLLPIGGTAFIWVPAVIYLWVTAGWGWAVALLVWGVIVVGVIDNLLKPITIGQGSGMPAVALFFGITGGLEVYGVAGPVRWTRRDRGVRRTHPRLPPQLRRTSSVALRVRRRRAPRGRAPPREARLNRIDDGP